MVTSVQTFSRTLAPLTALCLLPCLMAGIPAFSEGFDWDGGRWRLELSGFSGLESGSEDRSRDLGLNVTVEYEVPLWRRVALGLKMQPLFYYNEDDSGEDVWGIGFGPAFRVYQRADERTGIFGEFSISTLWHSHEFEGNSSKINFLSEVGLGYAFKKDWHMSLKWRHISNSGLGRDNSGLNGVGLGIGCTF